MIAYYEVTESIYNHLISDNDVNTVKIGVEQINDVDLNKQEIYPLSHIFTSGAEFVNGVVRFTVTVSVIDMVDITKKDLRDENEPYKGIDNEQDVLNSTLAVLENLDKSLRNGDLQDLGFELQGTSSAQRVRDTFPNLAIGWTVDFVIDVPNNVQNCG